MVGMAVVEIIDLAPVEGVNSARLSLMALACYVVGRLGLSFNNSTSFGSLGVRRASDDGGLDWTSELTVDA